MGGSKAGHSINSLGLGMLESKYHAGRRSLPITRLALCRFDNVHGSDPYGNPVDELPEEVLDSIKRNGVSSRLPHAPCMRAVCAISPGRAESWTLASACVGAMMPNMIQCIAPCSSQILL